jgi:hypothetical protein
MTPLSLEYCRRVREHLNLHNQQVVEGPATLGNMLVETEPHAKPRTTAPPLRGGLGPAIREIDSHGRARITPHATVLDRVRYEAPVWRVPDHFGHQVDLSRG